MMVARSVSPSVVGRLLPPRPTTVGCPPAGCKAGARTASSPELRLSAPNSNERHPTRPMMRCTWTSSSSEPNPAILPGGFNLVIKSLGTKPVVGENDKSPRGNCTNRRENEDPWTSRLKDREQDWERLSSCWLLQKEDELRWIRAAYTGIYGWKDREGEDIGWAVSTLWPAGRDEG
jgi:hypothetical protein